LPGFVRTRIMDSERNRPADLRTPARAPSEAELAWRSAYEELVSAGLAPERVADLVFDAVRGGRFYVFPHPELLEAVRSRMETILAQRNPEIALPEEMRSRLKF
jgi:hypothetical protein